MMHEQLDIAHWKQVFSVARMRAEGQKPEDFNITRPRSIVVIEQLREETFAALPGVERVPTDIFILNLGEWLTDIQKCSQVWEMNANL